jgi:exopolysaccharide biosynthesis polyprenyl glycosylphosphotransferase
MVSSESSSVREDPAKRRRTHSAARHSARFSAHLNGPHLLRLSLELLALFTAWCLTIELRLLLNPYYTLQFDRHTLQAAAPPPGAILLLWIVGDFWLHDSRRTRTSVSGMRGFGPAESMFVVMGVAILGTFFSRTLGAPLSRSFIMLLAPVGYGMLQAAYLVEKAAWRGAVKRWPPLLERVALVSRPADVERMMAQLQSETDASFRLCGVILPSGESEDDCEQETGAPIPILGRVTDLAGLINREALDRVIVARNGFTGAELSHCSRVSKRMGVVMSRELERTEEDEDVRFNIVSRMHLMDLRPAGFGRGLGFAIRCRDMIFAAAMVMLLSPVLLIAALLVRLTSEGPVLYRSKRVGKGGRHFIFLKFRTMYIAGHRREDLAAHNEHAGHLFKIKQDPRVTPVGRVLRRYSIDELPQLFNVLAGSMSLIGPRPLPAGDLEPDGMSRAFAFWAEQRAMVKPGMTGLWQIKGRSDLGFSEMMDLDIAYVQDWSMWLDVRILLATPAAVITGRGAY